MSSSTLGVAERMHLREQGQTIFFDSLTVGWPRVPLQTERSSCLSLFLSFLTVGPTLAPRPRSSAPPFQNAKRLAFREPRMPAIRQYAASNCDSQQHLCHSARCEKADPN